MDSLDRSVINRLQGDFPISEHPFADAARSLDTTEVELIARIEGMLRDGILTRFGPLYNAEKMGGAFTLAAMSIPAQDFERIAQIVNAMPEVAHNYERAHALNMWFVLATDTRDGIGKAIRNIEQATGYPVFNLPKIEEYFVEAKFMVQPGRCEFIRTGG